MFEKVNPKHPDKLADRIAGAIVDTAYIKAERPKIAVEVLLGHGECYAIIETSESFNFAEIYDIVRRIAGDVRLHLQIVPQDPKLAANQAGEYCCGDNGIFRGMPLTLEQKKLSRIARDIYNMYPSDGKYIIDLSKEDNKLVICQSNAIEEWLEYTYPEALVNPIGHWNGGLDVDSGATNRKLGSDMGDSITGGGLHGKDLSKADVSVNIYAFLKAQETGEKVELSCAIGDTLIDGKPYTEIVEIAKKFIDNIGGFEKFAEWGLF